MKNMCKDCKSPFEGFKKENRCYACYCDKYDLDYYIDPNASILCKFFKWFGG